MGTRARTSSRARGRRTVRVRVDRVAARWTTAMVCALLGACLGGSDESGDVPSAGGPPPAPVPPPPANAPPTISGTPAVALVPDSPYSFRPSAADPEGASLTFSVSNKPTWASFDAATGELSGTPAAGDVGQYEG